LIKCDDNEFVNITDAALAMERLIVSDKANFVMGGLRTEAVRVMQDVAMEHKTIFINLISGDPMVTMRVHDDYAKYKYFFRSVGLDNRLTALFHFLAAEPVVRKIQDSGIEPKIAMLTEKDAWGDSQNTVWSDRLNHLGIKIVGSWNPSAVATDVTSELLAIKNAGANVIFTALSAQAGLSFAKGWADLQIPACTTGCCTESTKATFWDDLGGRANYFSGSGGFGMSYVACTDKTIPFWTKYRERFGNTGSVNGYEPFVYDSIYVLKEAIERAGTLDADAVVAELEKTDHLGAGGRLVFTGVDVDSSHDITYAPGYITYTAVQWRDGKQVTIWPKKDFPSKSWGKGYLGSGELATPQWMVQKWPDAEWGVEYEGTGNFELPPWFKE